MNKKRKWLAFFCIVILNIFFLCACTPTMDNSNGKVDDEEGFVIACLGDSITEGVGVDNEEERYTVLLEQDEAISSVQNVGFSGSFVGYTNKTEHAYIDTYSFLKRYKNIKNLTDLIFVFGGTNDYASTMGCNPLGSKGDKTGNTFYGALNLLVNGLRDRYPEAKLLFATPLQRDDVWCGTPVNTPYNETGNTLEEYRNAIVEICMDSGVEYIDLYNLEGMRLTDENYKDYLKDGLHPNAKGNALIADAVLAKIRSMLNIA